MRSPSCRTRLRSGWPSCGARVRTRAPWSRSKLGVSISGLARAGVTEALTTPEIKALLQEMPQWLVTERATQAAVRAEALRAKSASAKKRSAATQR